MSPKITGACTKCDKDVFEITHEYPDGRRRLGHAHEDAVRLTFLLMKGSRMDLTFCQACADSLVPADYPATWARVMHSWAVEGGASHPNTKEQQDNAIVGLLGSRTWKELGYA